MNRLFIAVLLSLVVIGPSVWAQEEQSLKTDNSYGPKNQKKDYVKILLREIEKRNEYKDNFNKLSTIDQEASVSKAAQYYEKGREFFEKGNTIEAQKYFGKAVFLNPLKTEYNYELAVAAYRNRQHTHSLALLEIVNGTNIDPAEITYYEALNNMKLRENERAIKTFGDVVNLNDPELSSSAAMYRGILLKQSKRYEEAKAALQYVLDNAKDKDLDQKAEKTIEEIIALQQFEEESKKTLAFQLFSGFLYDSNVLNIAQNNSSLDLAAYRLLYGGSLEYKALHTYKHSLTPRISASDIFSLDNSFASNATIQSTDPLQFEVATPYTYRFAMWDKASAWTLTPAYSNLFMSLDEANRDLIYSTFSLASDLTTSFAESWINTIRVDIANDTFLPEGAPENDQTALKYGLTFANTKLFDTRGTKTASFDINYIKNDAEGVNSIYDRIMVSVGGTYPLSDKWTSYGKIDYLKQDFNKSIIGRSDKGYILTAGGLYPFNNKFSVNIYAQYQDNSSTVALYDFDKFSVMTMFAYNSGFF